MDIGLTLPTHGVMTRDDAGDCMLQNISTADMRPVEFAVRAEELGFHSVWLSDHIVTETHTDAVHPANSSGKRAYPAHPVMLDVPTTLGAIASRTQRIKFSPTVYISPYRHPLITAHEFATLDVLSGGRAILAVGVGWEVGEFEALGADFTRRGRVVKECIEIYRAAWGDQVIDYDGEFFQIHSVSMDLKPVQASIPIWYGGMSPIAARRAARMCEAFYPMYLDATTTPEDLEPLRKVLIEEADRLGRDLNSFTLGAFCQLRICGQAEIDRRFSGDRPLLTGSIEQIIDDIGVFADYGYSHLTMQLDCPSGMVAEYEDQMEAMAEILPSAAGITSDIRRGLPAA